jgi:large repetitive protein
VWASLTAIINAILSWDPFFYDVEVFVRVAAGVDISIWTPFGRAHISFSTSIGAGVHVWGPELRGEAELDLDVISVTVGFGSDGAQTSKDPIGWSEFHEKYLVAGDSTGETMSAAVVAGLLAADAVAGRSPGSGTPTDPWRVVPEFVIRTETRAASNAVAGHSLDPVTTQQLDIGPMKAVDVTSTHSLTVVAADGFDVTSQVDITPIVGPVPEGVWTALTDDPAPGAKVRSAYVGATLAAPARIGSPEGAVKLTQVEEGPLRTLPFANEIEDRQQHSNDVAEANTYIAAQPTGSLPILLAAASRLAQTGSFAVRTFAGDRVAPPRLAPLGEGMVDAVKPAVTTTGVPTPPPSPPDPAPGPLTLHAMLRAPAAKVSRGVLRTTVAPGFDGLPRSAPPTLASARRLAATFGPARLELRNAPLIESPDTVMAADGGVATTTAGGATELRSGLLASRAVANQMAGFDKALRTNAGAPLTAGDVQVWERPCAEYDTGGRSPSVRVEGDQVARVVALDRADMPLADQLGKMQTLVLPRGTARVAVVGLGAPGKSGRDAAGASGWHAETVLLQVGAAGYLGPGCVVTATSPATLRSRQAVTAAVVTAAVAVGKASAVTTRLPVNTHTVVVALEIADDPDEALAGLVLGLDGGERTSTPPTVVVSGTRAHGLFEVRALRRAVAMSVTVAADRRWRLAAVIGTRMEAAIVAPQIVELGLEEIIGTDQLSSTGSSTIRYQEAR